MAQLARGLARRLAAAGIDAAALAATVSDVSAPRAEAINAEGLRSQIEFLLETYAPAEIEEIALRATPAGRQQ